MRALIADDEPLLRADLRKRLARLWPELLVCAEAADGRAALELFERERPDIAFLDIRMPGRTGIEVAEALSSRCHIVFVTAYDQYAVQAFERGAHDYLVKPVTDARLAAMVERLRIRVGQPAPRLDELLRELAERLGARKTYLRWVKASLGDAVKLIAVEDILFFHADDKYTRVVTAEGESLIRTPIRNLIEELDPGQFWQVHRASVVNAHAVAGITRDDAGRLHVQLKGSTERLEVSRSYAHLFKQM